MDVQVVGIVVDQMVMACAEVPLRNGVITLEVLEDVGHKRPAQGARLVGLAGRAVGRCSVGVGDVGGGVARLLHP